MRGINEQYNSCKSKLKVSKRDVNLYTLCRINEKWHDNKMTLKVKIDKYPGQLPGYLYNHSENDYPE